MKWKIVFADVVSILFIMLWIYAAVSKLTDYQKFVVQLGKSPITTSFAVPVSILIPAMEILLSIFLFFSITRFLGLLLSMSLMVMFTAYIVAITQFSDFVPCSCGGVLEKLSWNQHLIFNVVFVLLALTATVFRYSKLPGSTQVI